MTNKVCPVCAEEVVLAHGDIDSSILIIGSSPSEEELDFHRPFVGNTGRMFRKELLTYAGIDLGQTRQVLLWWHPKPAAKKQSDCLLVSLSQVEKEFEGKVWIILVGADAVRHFTGKSVDDVCGMDVTDDITYEKEGTEDLKWFALPNPSGLYRSIGEMRFSLMQLKAFMLEDK